MAMRIFEGATLPVMISVGSAALAQLAGPGREGRAVALLYVGVVAAFALFVPIGVLVAERAGWAASFFGLAALAASAALLLALVFPQLPLTAPVSLRSQTRILRRIGILAHLLLSALLIAATFAAYTYLAAWLEIIAGYDSRNIAAMLTGFGVMGVAGNWIAGRLADHDPARAGIVVALVLAAVLAAVSLIGGNPWIFMPVLLVWGMTQAAVLLLCQVRTMQAAPEAPAFAASLNLSAGNLGIAAGAALGGWVVSNLGIGWIGAAGAVLAVAALALQRLPALR
jgi:predicted MFS family arabinose efflux permease